MDRQGTSVRNRRRLRAKRVSTHMLNLGLLSTSPLIIDTKSLLELPVYSSSSDTDSVTTVEPQFESSYFPTFNNESTSDSSVLNDLSVNEFSRALGKWMVEHNVTRQASNDLLKLLKKLELFKCLPSDCRTLLRNPKTAVISEIPGGKFCYFGMEQHIVKTLYIINFSLVLEDTINLKLELSFDGLPITKSTTSQFWPIQGSIVHKNIVRNPFIIGLYFGVSKPSDLNAYLADLIKELKSLCKNGFDYHSTKVLVTLYRIVADAPARSFIKQCKNHNSYHGCEKCSVKGHWSGRIIFTEDDKELRNDVGFKTQLDINHHIGVSPFIQIDFGLVSGVPLDYMHLVCLGVVRKLLRCWVKGPLPYKLSNLLITQISHALVSTATTCPREFSRRPRTLKELDMWKASEYRTFLLFTGPIVLKGILSSNLYNHFMLLHVAITILISKQAQDAEWNRYAKDLINKFVNSMGKLYSSDFMVYNVHSLLHLSQDALLHGPLDDFSAFRYENNMQFLKRMLRAKYKPFEQIVNRVHESVTFLNRTKLEKPSVIKSTNGNNCFILTCGSVVVITDILNDSNFKYKIFEKSTNFYKYPCESSQLNIFLLENLSDNVIHGRINDILLKCWLFETCNHKYVNVPMCNWAIVK